MRVQLKGLTLENKLKLMINIPEAFTKEDMVEVIKFLLAEKGSLQG